MSRGGESEERLRKVVAVDGEDWRRMASISAAYCLFWDTEGFSGVWMRD